MTTQRSTHALPIDDVGELIAAVPALLGFVPERSVVLLVHDDVTGRIGATARTDLGLTRAGTLRVDCRRHLGQAVGLLRRQGADRLYALVVDDRRLTKAVPALVDCLETVVSAEPTLGAEVVLADLFFVSAIADGARWLCRHGESGAVTDPATSPVALAAALEGRPVRASRTELVALLAAAGRGIGRADCLAAASNVSDRDPAELLGAVVAAVLQVGSRPEPLGDADVAVLGGALLDVNVRDAALSLSLSVVADDALEMFAELARRLRGTPRAAAALLVAASAYARGDGPLTGIALDAALAADPGYRAARLLAAAFENGISPRAVSAAAESGERVAARLGITMPPRDTEFPLAG
ncbi:hypothetical protein TPAU25S_02004 [Tsukamurella paurometabola]|uniref:DUF4192 domain-containing protein n=1 Tax=Tsukamurella paurometabola (strain ATCC 8368 / DSM 20162 / CCUG 35730 / CIP 100753 / JCM 10117 / KCTC 9821 / NBRC 16120 / NCIMB 702349 / NCTC 13040) TaxID=521096 RepID=D5UMV0_TSUPD|nr:DUF4192 domain-containing protein [Tsukamurella paurometabola]ADG78447.1 conserved hypothetical protein [Tsukamurella paurometabola DSM 20162]SUP31664.1 Uncharacterised protein [Tsukamurella paurometabola]